MLYELLQEELAHYAVEMTNADRLSLHKAMVNDSSTRAAVGIQAASCSSLVLPRETTSAPSPRGAAASLSMRSGGSDAALRSPLRLRCSKRAKRQA